MVETLPGAPPPDIIEEVPKYANGSLGPLPAGPCSAHTQEAKGIGELPPPLQSPRVCEHSWGFHHPSSGH